MPPMTPEAAYLIAATGAIIGILCLWFQWHIERIGRD